MEFLPSFFRRYFARKPVVEKCRLFSQATQRWAWNASEDRRLGTRGAGYIFLSRFILVSYRSLRGKLKQECSKVHGFLLQACRVPYLSYCPWLFPSWMFKTACSHPNENHWSPEYTGANHFTRKRLTSSPQNLFPFRFVPKKDCIRVGRDLNHEKSDYNFYLAFHRPYLWKTGVEHERWVIIAATRTQFPFLPVIFVFILLFLFLVFFTLDGAAIGVGFYSNFASTFRTTLFSANLKWITRNLRFTSYTVNSIFQQRLWTLDCFKWNLKSELFKGCLANV